MLSKCQIEGHYYKVDSGVNCDIKAENYSNSPSVDEAIRYELLKRGIAFYVKCQRCNNRILINDKTYEARQRGEYVL